MWCLWQQRDRKKGQLNTHHFAHVAGAACDAWRSSDTVGPWHRAWQSYCNDDALERRIEREGFYHIADVYNSDNGLVMEVQHNPMSYQKAMERETFYGNMLWMLDATQQEFSLLTEDFVVIHPWLTEN
jgi:competence protein CoiA